MKRAIDISPSSRALLQLAAADPGFRLQFHPELYSYTCYRRLRETQLA